MKAKTLVSALLLALSGAAVAQVATQPEIKGDAAGADNASSNRTDANAADPADNSSDPGQPRAAG